MRNPFSTEAEAFRLLVVVVACAVAVGLVGAFAGGWAALGVFVTVSLGAYAYLRTRPPSTEPPFWAGEGGQVTSTPVGVEVPERVVVVAAQACDAPTLPTALAGLLGGLPRSALLLVPVQGMSAGDRAVEGAARERVQRGVSRLLVTGVRADGHPLSTEDVTPAARAFGPVEVVVAVAAGDPGDETRLRPVVDSLREAGIEHRLLTVAPGPVQGG